jgi:membrane protease YdiL (CAAX protease family)
MSTETIVPSPAVEDLDQHSLGKSIVLHLLPGVLLVLFYIATTPLALKLGFPTFFALMVGIGIIIIPFELGYLLIHAKKRNGTLSLRGIVLYREPMPVWQYVVLTLLLVTWMGLFFGVLAEPIDKFFIDRFFTWIPNWFFLFGPASQLNQYPHSVLLATAILGLALNGIAGPVVEELYFRGHLLPRLSRLKGWAPVCNILLFSFYHFFTPWENLIRIFAITPMIYTVWWKKNIYIGIFVHCTGNLIGSIGMLVMVLGRA